MMLRKIKRAQEAARRQRDAELDDDEGDEDGDNAQDDSVIEGRSRNLKKERGTGRGRPVEKIEESDEGE